MDDDVTRRITTLLQGIQGGNKGDEARLFEEVYDVLRRQAHGAWRERAEHTLQPTALVHEAYLRLVKSGELERAVNRRHFFFAASRAMKQILIEHARGRLALKKGGHRQRVPLDETLDLLEKSHGTELLDLQEALSELNSLDRRQCNIVELRLFAGLEFDDIARQLELSKSTIEKEFRAARAWLNLRLS